MQFAQTTLPQAAAARGSFFPPRVLPWSAASSDAHCSALRVVPSASLSGTSASYRTAFSHVARPAASLSGARWHKRFARLHAHGDQGGSASGGMEDYVEVKVDSVRVSSGASVVFLRLCSQPDLVLPVHIGESSSRHAGAGGCMLMQHAHRRQREGGSGGDEAGHPKQPLTMRGAPPSTLIDRAAPLHPGENESSALLKEINKQRGIRPLTHDLTKSLLQAVGCRVTKIRLTELVRVFACHVCRMCSPPAPASC
jgi:hypothetical protein